MAEPRLKPGAVRDAILSSLTGRDEASVAEIHKAVEAKLGRPIARSSVRSYLNLNVPAIFVRVTHGHYKLKKS